MTGRVEKDHRRDRAKHENHAGDRPDTGTRGRCVADQRLVRPVAGVAQLVFARTVGRCRPRAPEEESCQRLAVSAVVQDIGRHRVLLAQCVEPGIGAKKIDVVLRHLCHCRGAIGAQTDHAARRVVGIAAHLGLQARVELRLLAGLQMRESGAEIALRPDLAQRDRLAVQPVGRPVRRKIAAVSPDRAQLLATASQPGFLTALHLPFREQGVALAAHHLFRNRWRMHEYFAAHPAQSGEGKQADQR